ncbi:hypothetical protein Pcaca05_42030 [Pectobacterium carotovorum subsp. carotovorum]|nr:hypothetical protein Pcaca05_42030 [Pectobacterium carotovorum subsp. carotovorum]
MTRLSSLSVSEKQFIDAAVFAAERAKGARLSGTDKKSVSDGTSADYFSA